MTAGDSHSILEWVRKVQPYTIAILFMLLYLAEHVFPQRKDLKDFRHDGINILIGIGNLLIAGLGGYGLQWLLNYLAVHHFGALYRLPLPWAMQLMISLILIDLFMYWWHRANHRVAFLWQFHKFHHVDTKLNTTSAVRFHAMELTLSYVAKVPVFALLGISAGGVALYALILYPVITLHHSNLRISNGIDRLCRIFFVSPKMHRIHHSIIRKETNSNFSSILPYWDMMFKSYHSKPEKPVEFGVSDHFSR